MFRSALLTWLFPAFAAALGVVLFAIAGWNALQVNALAGLLQTAAAAQPAWFCH